jgi:DNA-binding FrmR family transcriptional regulator
MAGKDVEGKAAAGKNAAGKAAAGKNVAGKNAEGKADGEERGCCCGGKTTKRSPEQQKKLLNRLSRIEGQIRGIKGMIEKDAYCADVLVQSAAVNSAINSFNRELLASHINSCVVRDIRNGDDKVVEELMELLQKLMK